MNEQNTRVTIGARLRQIREARGLSLRQLSEMTGYHFSNLSRIEQGKYSVSVDIVDRIAKAMGYHLEIVVDGIHLIAED